MKKRASRIGGVAFALLVLTQEVALAGAPEGDPQRAAESFRAARAAFEHGDFAQAGALFEAANTLSPHPTVLLNAAEAWELGGKPARAAEAYDAVIAGGDAKYAPSATARLARLEPKIATVDFRGSPSWRVRIDDGEEFHPARRRRLSAGTHSLTVIGLTTSPAPRSLTLRAGEHTLVELDAHDVPARPPGPPPREARDEPDESSTSTSAWPPVPSLVAFGIAGVSAAVAATFGVRTLAAQDDFNARPTPDTRDTFDRNKTVTNVSIGVAAASALVGVGLWVFLPRGRALSAQPVSGGGHLTLRTAF